MKPAATLLFIFIFTTILLDDGRAAAAVETHFGSINRNSEETPQAESIL